MSKSSGATLTASQRVRLARRWFNIMFRARTRAFAPLIFLLAILFAVSVLPRLVPTILDIENTTTDTVVVGLHGRLDPQFLPSTPVTRPRTVCFNVTASDMHPHRLLRLHAPLTCTGQWFLSAGAAPSMPRSTVVVTAPIGTPDGALIRTIRSVLHRTSPALLKDVIVSSHTNMLHAATMRALRKLPKTRVLLVKPPPVPQKDAWLSAAALRDSGAAEARGAVLVFLTAGTEVGKNWLEPLLNEIVEDRLKARRASVVLPTTHVLNPRTMQLSDFSMPRHPIVGHDWGLRPINFFRARFSGIPSRIESPLLSGMNFAVRATFLRKIGGIGSGGRVDFALRVWLCGGSIASASCSTVAVPRMCNRREGPAKRRRRLATARLWMGRYEFLARFANNASMLNGFLVNRRKCASFDTYLRIAFPEMQASAVRLIGNANGPKAWGELRSATGYCVALVDDEFLASANCADRNIMLLTDPGFIVATPNMTAACMTRVGDRLLAKICTHERREMQEWQVERERHTQVFAGDGDDASCLTVEDGGLLVMRPCKLKDSSQSWSWQHRSRRKLNGVYV